MHSEDQSREEMAIFSFSKALSHHEILSQKMEPCFNIGLIFNKRSEANDAFYRRRKSIIDTIQKGDRSFWFIRHNGVIFEITPSLKHAVVKGDLSKYLKKMKAVYETESKGE